MQGIAEDFEEVQKKTWQTKDLNEANSVHVYRQQRVEAVVSLDRGIHVPRYL